MINGSNQPYILSIRLAEMAELGSLSVMKCAVGTWHPLSGLEVLAMLLVLQPIVAPRQHSWSYFSECLLCGGSSSSTLGCTDSYIFSRSFN